MNREAHEKLMAGGKFKPGDIVWTNVKTYSPWPGKVLHVPCEILKIYPDKTKIMYYVELYMKKDRDFHLEDELWPFNDGQGKFSVRKRSLLFHQAVVAAKEEARTGLPEDIAMDVENSASFCRTQFLRNNPRNADHHENMQKKVEGDFLPTRRHLKNNSSPGKIQNKDLNSQDIYEFSEFDPLVFTAGRKVLRVESTPERKTRSGTSNMAISIRKSIPQLNPISGPSLRAKPSLPMNKPSFKRKMPLMEKVLESRINPELESLNKNIGRVTPNVESKLDVQPAPMDNGVKAKIPKVEKVALRRSGRNSMKRQYIKTEVCDETVEERKPNLLLGKATILNSISEEETKVNDLPDVEMKLNDLPSEKGISNDTIEEQPEPKAQGSSSHMLLSPRMGSPEPSERTSVGFLGLGGLGKKIVRKLLADGHEVTLWNRSLYKTYEMLDIGAQSKSTAEQVINSCDVTFCCVSDTNAVKEVFYSSTGALSGIREGKTFVLLSTIEPKASVDIERAVKDRGGLYVEAPMFPAGGEIIDNALMTVVAGSRCGFRISVPYLRSFVKDVFYIGDVPDGTKMILLMKTLSGVKIAALAECMALAERCDVPTNILFQIIKQTEIASQFLISKAEAMLQAGPWSEDDVFPLAHFSNDLSSTLNLTSELRTPVTAAAKQVYIHSKLRGYSEHDVSAVYLKYTEPF